MDDVYAPPQLKISALGKPAVILVDGGFETAVDGFETTKTLALFCYLALVRGPHERAALARLLWSDDTQAHDSLRAALSNLNGLFPNHLAITRTTVAFEPDSPHWLDVTHFAAKTDALTSAAFLADIDDLRAAVALYRGDLLDDLDVTDAPAFAEWLRTERAHWRARAIEALTVLAEKLIEQRIYDEAADVLPRLLALQPWHEAAHRQRMVALSRTGQFDAALRQYARCRAILQAELGVEPAPETVALYERIRTARRARPHAVPTEPTLFVGRTTEIDMLHSTLLNPYARLITLVGFGGMGKTRLAIEVAHQAEHDEALLFLNGIVFVPFQDVTSSEQVPLVLAQHLGVHLSGQADPVHELIDHLRNQEMLLILDNFEHLRHDSSVLATILQAAPHIKLLVTSRHPLDIEDEWRFDLEGLDYPPAETLSLDQLETYSAVQLFLQCARQIQPGFTVEPDGVALVQRICRLVLGMPLGIKLAAAWLRSVPLARIVDEVASNLDFLSSHQPDLPARQRSIRAVFDYMWYHLSADEQTLWAALSVFVGGFREEAAQAVAAATDGALARLVEQGLLQLQSTAHGTHYFMHELVQQYAAEQLQRDPATAGRMQMQHCLYFARFLHERESDLMGGRQREVAAEIEADLDNIHRAWQWAVEHAREPVYAEALHQSAMTLSLFYHIQSRYVEGARNLARTVQQLDQAESSSLLDRSRVPILMHWAWFNIHMGRIAVADAILGQCEMVYGRLGTPPLPGYVTDPRILRGDIALIRGDYPAAVHYGTQALRNGQTHGHICNQYLALDILSLAALQQGSYQQAQRYAQQAYDMAHAVGDRWYMAMFANALGHVARITGDYDAARVRYQESCRIKEEFRDQQGMAWALYNLGETARCEGHFDEAVHFYDRSLVLYGQISDRGGLAGVYTGLGYVASAAGDRALASQHLRHALRTALDLDASPFTLMALTAVADFYLRLERFEQAYTILDPIIRHPSTVFDTRAHARALRAQCADIPPALVSAEPADIDVALHSLARAVLDDLSADSGQDHLHS